MSGVAALDIDTGSHRSIFYMVLALLKVHLFVAVNVFAAISIV